MPARTGGTKRRLPRKKSTRISLEDQDWWTLLRSIREGQCILLLGPGVAVDPADPAGDPLPVRLAHKLTEKLKQVGKGDQLIAPSDLAHVAQTYQREMSSKRPGLEYVATEFYKPYRDKTTALHQDLAALPFSLCISTTPDRFLLNAFSKRPGKQPIYDTGSRFGWTNRACAVATAGRI
jgi:hypothetical protein